MTLATWQGPFDATIWGPQGKMTLRPGDEYDVGDTELKSAHWKRVRAPKPDTTTVPAVSDTPTGKAAD